MCEFMHHSRCMWNEWHHALNLPVYWFEKRLGQWKISIQLLYNINCCQHKILLWKCWPWLHFSKKYIGATFQGEIFFCRQVWKMHTLVCAWTVINSLHVVNITSCVTICLNDSTNFTEISGLQFKDKINNNYKLWQYAWMTALISQKYQVFNLK